VEAEGDAVSVSVPVCDTVGFADCVPVMEAVTVALIVLLGDFVRPAV